ncbi:hypothetical protein B0H66DRAFT_213213 [Apodospora peruviana]|uniref:Uncharacterized protein n=1 Tax=Apodospora peruviana TaxID=516989 RepID=A0AAE0ICP4_9PEZI|nr:hypothetical protein B0H66DRAFT_213213 [Apodospora peruviana]
MTREKREHDHSMEPLYRWTPWLGITSILVIFLCAAGSAIIVAVSNDDVVEEWKIKPAVLLAVLSASSNVAFSTALATGVAVRFWLHATRGTLLTQLHHIWDHGRGIGLIHSLRAGSEARRVAIIATLGYIVQFSTGPLLQRATYQVSQDHVTQSQMFMDISNRIPDGWMGTMQDGTVVAGRKRMSQTQDWYRNATIEAKPEPGYTCEGGTCIGSVRGAGFVSICRPLPVREMALLDKATDDATVFLVKPTYTSTPTGTTYMNLTTFYISDLQGKCMATIKGDECNISTAIVEYPVIISNSTVSLRYYDLSNMTIISPYQSAGDLLSAPTGAGAGPLQGLQDFIEGWLAENSTKLFNTAVNKTLYSSEGFIADIFFQAEPWDYSNRSQLIQCGLSWRSPTDYVIKAMHDYMFRVALRTGRQYTEKQTFSAAKTTSEIVFWSDNRYLGAALATTACCLALMTNLIWGWWRLDQKVTLSPLETARAFGGAVNGPLFRHVRPDGTIEDILKAVEGVEFKLDGGSRKHDDGATMTQLVTAAPSSAGSDDDCKKVRGYVHEEDEGIRSVGRSETTLSPANTHICSVKSRSS